MKKKSVFLVLFFSLTSIFSFAQSFNGGLIGGATFAQIDGEKLAGYHKLGLTGGAYVNIPVAEHFVLQTELKYTQMGAKSTIKEAEIQNKDLNIRLHYVEFPIMMRYDFGYFIVNGKKADFINLEAGLSLDFLMKSVEEINGAVEETAQFWKFFSITANAGIHFILTDHIGIGARMIYSITPIRTNTISSIWNHGHSTNKVIQLTLTYNINSPLR